MTSKIWERVAQIAESEFDEGLNFDAAKETLEDWVSFAKFHVLLQAALDMNQEEATRGGISKEDKAAARKIASAIQRCLQVVEPLEKAMKSPGEK